MRTALLLPLALTLAACGGDDASSTDEAAGAVTSTIPPETVADTSPAASTPADASAYCERIASLEGDRPEAYVGSAEQEADIESLIEVAPDVVMAPLQTFAGFLASGAIVADDPDSKLVENWPPEVQTAIAEITAIAG